MMFYCKLCFFLLCITIIVACNSIDDDAGDDPANNNPGKILTEWTETNVRKVLHVFAYGGQSTDEQISTWAAMDPQIAIKEILSFAEVNNKLSPTVDNTASNGGKLKDLMEFWSSTPATTHLLNPYPDNERSTTKYSLFYTYPDTHSTFLGQTFLANSGLQLTLIAPNNFTDHMDNA